MKVQDLDTVTANRRIAEFMGLIPIPAGTKALGQIKHPEESEAFLNYDRDWNLLMPVVEKIMEYALVYPDQVKEVIGLKIIVKRSILYNRVVQFIDFYTTSKKEEKSK